jgi:hypothetical protein
VKDEIKSIIETELEYGIEDSIFLYRIISSDEFIFQIRPKDDVDWFNHKHPFNSITVSCYITDSRLVYDLKRLYNFTNKVGFFL